MKFMSVVGRGALFTVPSGAQLADYQNLSAQWNKAPVRIAERHIHRAGKTTFLSVLLDFSAIAGTGELRVLNGSEVVATTPATAGETMARASRVVAGRLTGWISRFGTEPADRTLRLVIDGVHHPAKFEWEPRIDFRHVSNAGAQDGYSVDIPALAFDGEIHEFGIALEDGRQIAPKLKWGHRLEGRAERVSTSEISGWCYDTLNKTQAVRVSLVADGAVVASQTCQPRPELNAALGATAVGFRFEIPPQAREIAIAPSYAPDLPVIGPLQRTERRDQVEAYRGAIRSARMASDKAIDPAVLAALREAIARERASGTDTFAPVLAKRTAGAAAPRADRPVVIVPVYDGYDEVVACFESVLAHTPRDAEIIAIDDCSPSKQISKYLAGLQDKKLITLLVNPKNLGFPRTVNRALDLRAGRDVVLLNADTVVPARWLERLTEAARREPFVASLTPLSNNATIFSYPEMNVENPLPLDITATALDAIAAKVNAGQTFEAPVGVGFCMYLSAQALDEVGPLSTEWGRGYGEEVDWCMKARDLGFANLVMADMFVVHEGSVSFGADTRKKLVALNSVALNERYPEYVSLVQSFIQRDPLRLARLAIDRQRIKDTGLPVRLHVTNNFTGGTQVHVREEIKAAAETELGCILRPYAAVTEWDQSRDAGVTLRVPTLGLRCFLTWDELPGFLADIMGTAPLGMIVHSTLSWTPSRLASLLGGSSYETRIHDYAWFCPRIQMFRDGQFCGMPEVEICEACVMTGDLPRGGVKMTERGDLARHLEFHRGVLEGASVTVAPSETAKGYMERRFPVPITVQAHEEQATRFTIRRIDPGIPIVNLAFLGAIGPQKGYEALRAISRTVHEERLPIQIQVIGYTSDNEPLVRENPNILITGRYERNAQAKLLADLKPDLVMIPSLWPETYSYVLSEAWGGGLPVVTFDIGATAERVRRHGGGLILPLGTPWETLPALILDHIARGTFKETIVDISDTQRPAGRLAGRREAVA